MRYKHNCAEHISTRQSISYQCVCVLLTYLIILPLPNMSMSMNFLHQGITSGICSLWQEGWYISHPVGVTVTTSEALSLIQWSHCTNDLLCWVHTDHQNFCNTEHTHTFRHMAWTHICDSLYMREHTPGLRQNQGGAHSVYERLLRRNFGFAFTS